MGFQRQLQLLWVLLVALDFCARVKANLESYPNCSSDSISSIGDGYCDWLTNNNKACGYDEGDCCECTCILNPNRDYSCEFFECLDPNSGCADPSLSQYTNCTGYVSMIGNSRCNSENNNEACAWDEGDCCECTCIPESSSGCDTGSVACLDPDSGCADSSLVDYIDCGGDLSSFGDGACNSENNNEACGWDGGDCCECTCVGGSLYDCESSEFFCKDPNSACIDPLVVEYENCGGDLSSYEDGSCDSINNNQACGWDGGDCCECTCNGDICLNVDDDSDCSDPDAARGSYGCMDWPTKYQPCMPEIQQKWVVKTTQEASNLAEALNCSGGVFEVEWHGNVAINQTLRIVEGTILNMTGSGPSAIMDGSGGNGLFVVMNAFLYVGNMTLVNGSSISGGAIAALGSRVCLNYTRFVGNAATHNGGALFVAEGSTIAGSEEIEFANNRASRYGGAVCARGQSVMTWADDILYLNNSAGNGGAVDVSYGSIALWTGVGGSTFTSNFASFLGGALYVDSESSTTWEGESIFEYNYAGSSGGGSYMSSSQVSWRGRSKFIGNTAGSGGGLFLSNVSATWAENVSIFSRNSAEYGGALYGTSYSNISWAGETIFSSNIGQVDGGAFIVADVTTASWSATTTFFNNTAFSDGGGVYLVDGSIASWMETATFANNSAGNDGGVLRVCPSSTTFSGGRTTFSGNTAGRDGGALYLEGAAAWEGETALAENIAANQGGAVCVKEGGTVSWSANTLFVHNSADTGGALVATSGFYVSWTAETNFTSNRARQDGGALALTFSSSNQFSSLSNEESSTIVITGKSNFAYNKCGWSGGAMSLSGLLSISANASLVFVGNAADVYGGAVYVSSMDIGPVFHGARFDSNQAQVGGGVYAAASGTMVTVDTVNNDPNEHPTTFDSCTFINNEAFDTGGGGEQRVRARHFHQHEVYRQCRSRWRGTPACRHSVHHQLFVRRQYCRRRGWLSGVQHRLYFGGEQQHIPRQYNQLR